MAKKGKITLGINAAAGAAKEAASAVGEVTKKIGEKAELAHISSAISKAQKEKDNIFREIGLALYTSKEGGEAEAPDFTAQFESIKAHDEEIKKLRHRSADLRGYRICPTCEKECLKADGFCSKCGTKISEE